MISREIREDMSELFNRHQISLMWKILHIMVFLKVYTHLNNLSVNVDVTNRLSIELG